MEWSDEGSWSSSEGGKSSHCGGHGTGDGGNSSDEEEGEKEEEEEQAWKQLPASTLELVREAEHRRCATSGSALSVHAWAWSRGVPCHARAAWNHSLWKHGLSCVSGACCGRMEASSGSMTTWHQAGTRSACTIKPYNPKILKPPTPMHGRHEALLRAKEEAARAREREQEEEAARAAAARRRRRRQKAARAAAAQRRQQEEAAYAAMGAKRAAQQAEVDTHARLLQAQREECGPGLRFQGFSRG